MARRIQIRPSLGAEAGAVRIARAIVRRAQKAIVAVVKDTWPNTTSKHIEAAIRGAYDPPTVIQQLRAISLVIRRANHRQLSAVLGDEMPPWRLSREMDGAFLDAAEAFRALEDRLIGLTTDDARSDREPVSMLNSLMGSLRAKRTSNADIVEALDTLKDLAPQHELAAIERVRMRVLRWEAKANAEHQEEAGVKRYIWRTKGDGRVRPSHYMMGGTTHRWSAPPLVGGRRLHPGEDFNCFPGSAPITFVPGIVKLYRARGRGEATSLVVSSGETLLVTPNHPLLTDGGWKAAGALEIGDKLVFEVPESLDGSGVDKHGHVSFEQLWDFFSDASASESTTSSGSEFHGDVLPDSQIDIVHVDWGLMLKRYPALSEPFAEIEFARTDAAALAVGHVDPDGVRLLPAADGFVRFSDQLLSLVARQSLPAEHVGLAAGAGLKTDPCECGGHGAATHAEAPCDFEHARPGREQIAYRFVDVVSSVPRPLSGFVYTLGTHTGFYHVSVVAANCRCWAEPIPSREQERIAKRKAGAA